MREYTPRKDGKPRFFGGSTGEHTVIVDQDGYHEYCGTCKRILLEYRLGHGLSARTCHCSNVPFDNLIAQLWRSIDTCTNVDEVKRMLMMFVAQKDLKV